MNIKLVDTLSRKYFLPAHTLTNPYSEDRNGSMYLVDGDGMSAYLCDAIVSIEIL